jgi:hypothetical protein
VDVKKLVFDHFFRPQTVTRSSSLTSEDVAKQVALAYEALVDCIPVADRPHSVLLGSGPEVHTALQNGFVAGVLTRLLRKGIPPDWTAELRALGFDTSDWKATSWATAVRGGTEGNINRDIAAGIFKALFTQPTTDLFPSGAVPAPVRLEDYFTGDAGFFMQVQGRRYSGARKVPFRSTTDPSVELRGGVLTNRLHIGSERALSIGQASPNVVDVMVYDEHRPHDKDFTYRKLKTGLKLGPNHLSRQPIVLKFRFTFYGGRKHELTLKVDWT